MVYAPFPDGITDGINYDASLKSVLFLLNSRCNVSLEKTARFVSDLTSGALSPGIGMINGLYREFSEKTKAEQNRLFAELLDTLVMHVDGTCIRINDFVEILVHDHEAAFFHYSSDHQDCMVHIEKPLRDSM